MRHIVIFFMSTFNPNATAQRYHDPTGSFQATCLHTNETALKYIDWVLTQKGEHIDSVYAIVTQQAKDNAYPRFAGIFATKPYSITPVELAGEASVENSFQIVSALYDKISSTADPAEPITVHMDFTGGFRHSAMLMLVLLEMLRFSGMTTGLVTYTNASTQTIENAEDLLSMFTLTSGASEFASHGLADRLQQYFSDKDCSYPLAQLLAAMDGFSDRLRICSKLEDMQSISCDLGEALSNYTSFLAQVESNMLSPQEQFFSKLLPTIKREYQGIIASSHSAQVILHILKWCLSKGLLQQAVTLYTQWIPYYLVTTGLLTVVDKTIQTKCEALGALWQSWEVGLCRSYIPEDMLSSKQYSPHAPLTQKLLRDYVLKGMSADEIRKTLPQGPHFFRTFLSDLKDLAKRCTNFQSFYITINTLKKDNPIRRILEGSCPPSDNYYSYIKKRYTKTLSVEKLVLIAIRNVPSTVLAEIFPFADEIESKVPTPEIPRSSCFRYLLSKGSIKSRIPADELCQLMDDYASEIVTYRNSFNHASASIDNTLSSTLERDLSLLLQL